MPERSVPWPRTWQQFPTDEMAVAEEYLALEKESPPPSIMEGATDTSECRLGRLQENRNRRTRNRGRDFRSASATRGWARTA